MVEQPNEFAWAALQALPVAVVLIDATGEICARNRAAEEMGLVAPTLSEMLACRDPDRRTPDWSRELAAVVGGAEPVSYAGLMLGSSDASRLVDVYLGGLGNPGRQRAAAMVVVEDVTGRVSMERRLATSERLATVGKLAAQVAHELNNPLDGIQRFLGLMERACESGDRERMGEYLDQVRSGVVRMTQIVANLLDFSRSAGRTAENSPLHSLIDQAVEAMAPSMAAAGVTVVCDLDSSTGRVVSGNLFQVFCNLMKNAADAMTGGGRLVITCRCDKGLATIRFADTGPGVPPELARRVFEPFFSTKPSGKGTGLGLSICRGIVERADGTIDVADRPGRGAVFTVKMPYKTTRAVFGA